MYKPTTKLTTKPTDMDYCTEWAERCGCTLDQLLRGRTPTQALDELAEAVRMADADAAPDFW